jgi:hypothetical protein
MGKRPRTPHFITGIGDGDVHDHHDNNQAAITTDDAFQLRGNNKNKIKESRNEVSSIIQPKQIFHQDNSNNADYFYNLRAAQKERLQRLQEPMLASSGDGQGGADHWRDVFGNPVLDHRTMGGKTGATFATGPWQVSAFAFLGLVVVVSAVFLHFVSDSHYHQDGETNHQHSSPYMYRRRQRQRRKDRLQKKKTDEWSDDEEPIQNGAGLSDGLLPAMIPPSSRHAPDPFQDGYQTPCYYANQPSHPRFQVQDSRWRGPNNPYSPGVRTTGSRHRTNSSGSNFYPSQSVGGGPSVATASTNINGVNPTYKSPAPNNLMNSNNAPRMPQRGLSPKNSFSSHGSRGHPQPQNKPQYGSYAVSPVGVRPTSPLSGRNRVPSTPDAKNVFRDVGSSSHHSTKSTSILPAPPEESPLLLPKELHDAGPGKFELNARPTISSNVSSFPCFGEDNVISGYEDERNNSHSSHSPYGSTGRNEATDRMLVRCHSSQNFRDADMHTSRHGQSLLLSPGNYEETPVIGNARKVIDNAGSFDEAALMPPNGTNNDFSHEPPHMPYIPTLAIGGMSPAVLYTVAPPRSVFMDEIRLVQMETGNSSPHWEVGPGSEVDVLNPHIDDFDPSYHEGSDVSSEGSDVSIPSNDPRKGINHKRPNLDEDTDATQSLQSDINFEDLQLKEVIGGGGFGQVWRASLRGTPVAVKVLTGSAQKRRVAKAILEEFQAEINLLKGMRHPNVCLYMGACVDPPNRAIITELAANGSVWDALRLPLMPPYMAADGTSQGSWPMSLYMPDHHGAPPSSLIAPRISAPIPPRGSWPFQLVQRVSCGAARGMAYLHGGKPPVLHRDLKSANLLLDESYNTKVCDFGLSRLKAQTRSMTGNCGTVQWMAPEVLANRKYDEKADVYSFGIILWELLARECPYEGMTAIQCALAVLNRDKRPEIPKWCPPGLHALIKACVKKEPSERPSFERIIDMLDDMH